MADQPVYKTYREFLHSRQDVASFEIKDYGFDNSAFHTIDISSTGSVHTSSMELSPEERSWSPDKYLARLETERGALKFVPNNIKTRLVVFEQDEDFANFVNFFHNLYFLEFRIGHPFLRACSSREPLLFPEESSPAILNLGEGWCAKFIDREFDHPLTRSGMTISRDNLNLVEINIRLLASVLICMPSMYPMRYLPNLYVEMISQWASADLVDANEQPVKFLVPMLELRVDCFQLLAIRCYEKFRADRPHPDAERFTSSWIPLRDAAMNGTLPFEAFKRYDSCHFNGAVQQSNKLQELLSKYHDVRARMLELEQHVRDELQLQVGHLSLLESRESIKQSKIAIEESKRVKMRMYTVLS